MKDHTVGSKGDMNPDWYLFRRQHTGDLVSSGRALVALWPILVAGLVFIGCGALLINRAANNGVALGGLCMGMIGLVVVAVFFWLMQRKNDR